MKITNSKGLPEVLVSAIRAQQRDPEPGLWSITELLGPAYQRKLQRDHWEDLTEDVKDRAYAIIGTGLHATMEKAATAEAGWLSEHHVAATSLPVHGTLDLFDTETGTLWDIKTTSVWKLVNGSPEEWSRQLNGYRWLLSEADGLVVSSIKVLAFLRDWSKVQAQAYPGGYPDDQVQVVDLPLWTLEATRAFYAARLAEHQSAEPPLCTPEERWQRPTQYAVEKAGNKRALRVLATEQEAQDYVLEKNPKGDVSIVERPGEDVRCVSWCNVSHLCPHGRELVTG